MFYFVEDLNLWSWIFRVWPKFILKSRNYRHVKRSIFYIDSTDYFILFLKRIYRNKDVRFSKLEFRMADISDDDGRMIRFKIDYDEWALFDRMVIDTPLFQEWLSGEYPSYNQSTYLIKRIVGSLHDRNSIWRAIYLILVCQRQMQNMKNNEKQAGEAVLFLRNRPWPEVVKDYARKFNITVIFVQHYSSSFLFLLRRYFSIDVRMALYYFKRFFRSRNPAIKRPRQEKDHYRPACIAVPSFGYFNLTKPEHYSDLFFWQQSGLKGRNILMTFNIRQEQLDQEKYVKLAEHEMSGIALDPAGTDLPIEFLFRPKNFALRYRTFTHALISRYLPRSDAHWIKEQATNFQFDKEYWLQFFKRYNVKIYATWIKIGADHCAIAEAMDQHGGLLAVYQRSCEYVSSPHNTVTADINFVSSRGSIEIERKRHSSIRQLVVTGYLGDHRFPLLKEKASKIKKTLRSHGAKRILSYFDENSHPDPRWYHISHADVQKSYSFLLEKVLSHTDVGLILKPKVPHTLPRRLGPVNDLLEQALNTRRCIIYREGAVMNHTTPVEAALASDIAVHGYLFAATAGVEAVLARVPTLMFDGEGCPNLPFHKPGKGKIVFNDWSQLWEACEEYWTHGKEATGIGDGTHIFDDLDPFRDGRAAERMGTYLQWLIEGFEEGLSRDIILADAAERYCKLWGEDKVIEISPDNSWT